MWRGIPQWWWYMKILKFAYIRYVIRFRTSDIDWHRARGIFFDQASEGEELLSLYAQQERNVVAIQDAGNAHVFQNPGSELL